MTITPYIAAPEAIMRIMAVGKPFTSIDVHKLFGDTYTYCYVRTVMLKLVRDGKLTQVKGRSPHYDTFMIATTDREKTAKVTTRAMKREPLTAKEWVDIAEVLYLEWKDKHQEKRWDELSMMSQARWVAVAKMASCIFEDIEDVE